MQTISARTIGPEIRCDVAIVGLGPVGITLANLLGSFGHTVVALDAAPEIFDMPRAIGLDHESMRTFQSLGLAERMAPFIETYRQSEYRAADGALLRRLVAAPEPHPLAWPPNLTFVQPDLERTLREHARRWPNLALRLGAKVTEVKNIDAEPTLVVREVATEAMETISCRFAVACDGGASFLRKALAIINEDLDFDEPWPVIDMILTEEVELAELNIQFCDPARPATYVRGPGPLRRWEFMLLPGDDPVIMQRHERIWELLRPWLHPDQARIWRAATYRFHALVAESWRKGRVFLAGDAAHQTPPFLAQGLNQGIRDAANLAWKLSAVLRGAPDELLDTYEVERRPNVREVIATTKELGRLICERDPRAATERNRVMQAEVAAGAGTRVRQALLPPIRQGLIAYDERRRPVSGAGEVCPQPWIVEDGKLRRLDDLLGGGFYILIGRGLLIDEEVMGYAAAIRAKIARLEEAGQAQQIGASGERIIVEADHVLASWMSERMATAIVVRPDHSVFGAASDGRGLKDLLRSLAAAMGVAQSMEAHTRKPLG